MPLRILFLYPSDNLTFNAGVASLAALARQEGHEVRLLQSHQEDFALLDDLLERFRPHLAAVSSVTLQFPLASSWIRHIRTRDTGIRVLVGGVHATLCPEEVTRVEGVDALCLGEGEETWLELLRRLEAGVPWEGVAGTWVRTEGVWQKNPLRPLMTGLDHLPLPDYELFEHHRWVEREGTLMVFANRGCPYRCSYCVNHSLIRMYPGQPFTRWMSVPRLMEHLQALVARYPGAVRIEFFDDTFILKKSWLEAFAEAYPGLIGLPYICNVRGNLVNREVVDLLARSGCVRVNMAVETGNEELRFRILQKEVTNRQLLRAARLLRRSGIFLYTHNMIGIPHETEATIRQTIRLNRRMKVDDLQCWTFFPFQGTDARAYCEQQGWISDRQVQTVAGSNTRSVLDQPGLSPRTVTRWQRQFRLRVLGRRLPQEQWPRTRMVMGDDPQLGPEWHALEHDGDRPFRWGRPTTSFWLGTREGRWLYLDHRFPAPVAPPRTRVLWEGRELGAFVSRPDVWTRSWFRLPRTGDPLVELTLEAERGWEAREVSPEDPRVMGMALSGMGLCRRREVDSVRDSR